MSPGPVNVPFLQAIALSSEAASGAKKRVHALCQPLSERAPVSSGACSPGLPAVICRDEIMEAAHGDLVTIELEVQLGVTEWPGRSAALGEESRPMLKEPLGTKSLTQQPCVDGVGAAALRERCN